MSRCDSAAIVANTSELFAGAGNSGEYGDPALGDLQAHVPQVVLTRTPYPDDVVGVGRRDSGFRTPCPDTSRACLTATLDFDATSTSRLGAWSSRSGRSSSCPAWAAPVAGRRGTTSRHRTGQAQPNRAQRLPLLRPVRPGAAPAGAVAARAGPDPAPDRGTSSTSRPTKSLLSPEHLELLRRGPTPPLAQDRRCADDHRSTLRGHPLMAEQMFDGSDPGEYREEVERR